MNIYITLSLNHVEKYIIKLSTIMCSWNQWNFTVSEWLYSNNKSVFVGRKIQF